MKACPSCKELNGEGRDTCWKCNTELPKSNIETGTKICPNCKTRYSYKASTCEKCRRPLTPYTNYQPPKEETDAWMFVVAALIPIVGIIMGCIQLSRGKDSVAKSLIATSIVAFVVYVILINGFSSCAAPQPPRYSGYYRY